MTAKRNTERKCLTGGLRAPILSSMMNRLVGLERSRAALTQEYHHAFTRWLWRPSKALSIACSNLLARIELVDAYIKREISQ